MVRCGVTEQRLCGLCCPLVDKHQSSRFHPHKRYKIKNVSVCKLKNSFRLSFSGCGLDGEKSVCVRALVEQYERGAPDEQDNLQQSR